MSWPRINKIRDYTIVVLLAYVTLATVLDYTPLRAQGPLGAVIRTGSVAGGGGGGGADVTAPVVTITSPTTNPTYDAGTTTPITVSGTATDAVGPTSVTWSNDLGLSDQACTGTTSWSCSVALVESTSNDITIEACDAAANCGTDTFQVTYAEPSNEFTVVFRTSFHTDDDPDWNQEYVDAGSGDVWENIQTPIGTTDSISPGRVGQGGTGNGTGSKYNGITTAANNPNGHGGMGFEEWNYGVDSGIGSKPGTNAGPSALLQINWPTAAGSFAGQGLSCYAFRYYQSYASGFEWTQSTPPHYDKDWHPSYLNNAANAVGYTHTNFIPGWQDGRINQYDGASNYGSDIPTDYWYNYFVASPPTHNTCSAASDNCLSDGSWIAIEHVMDHTTGEGWAYIDGTLIQYNSGMNHTGKVALGWDTNNQNTVAGTQHVKYVDDIVVAEVACGSPPAGGWIGPYNGSRGY